MEEACRLQAGTEGARQFQIGTDEARQLQAGAIGARWLQAGMEGTVGSWLGLMEFGDSMLGRGLLGAPGLSE